MRRIADFARMKIHRSWRTRHYRTPGSVRSLEGSRLGWSGLWNRRHQAAMKAPVKVGADQEGAPRQPETPPAIAKLSPRERELVTLVAQGRTNAEIAARLFISVRTVASHLERIRDKTGCRRRADLTRLALSEGLI
jgi:DNA-binding CsgD family transcriptional regulator